MMTKKSKIITGLLMSGVAASLVMGIAGSFAWFDARNKLNLDTNVKGTVEGSYFARGTGTRLDPFIINKPRHLYNLAWLTYQGYFEKDANHDGVLDRTYYFALDPDLPGGVLDGAVDGVPTALPPIGTSEHPFYGNFEGNGKTIQNFEFTNVFSEYQQTPLNITNTGEDPTYVAPEIVGFIGVIGNLTQSYTYDTYAAKFQNTTLKNITIRTGTTRSLVGIAAGYVNGTLDHVAVDTSKITVDSTTTTALTAYTQKLSDYSIVGYCTNEYKQSIKKVKDKVFDVNVDSNVYTFNAATGGADQGWGGSVDMMSMYQRLYAIRYKGLATSVNTFTYVSYDDYLENEYLGHHSGSTNKTASDVILRYTDDDVGHFNFGYRAASGSSGTTSYLYIQGGHYEYRYDYSYRNHTGFRITTDDTNFLTVNSFTNNGGTIGNTTTRDDATVWSYNDSTHAIYTTYYYNNGSTPTTYYLNANESTGALSLSTSTYYQFTKGTDANNNVKFYNKTSLKYSYLTYSSGWKLVTDTAPTEPPVVPNPGPKPTQDDYPHRNASDYRPYQISYTTGGTKYYLQPDATFDTDFGNGWTFTPSSSSTIQSNNGYLGYTRSTTWAVYYEYTLALKASDSTCTWTVTSNKMYQYLDTASLGFLNDPKNYYLRYNSGNLEMSDTNSNNTFTFETSASLVAAYNTHQDELLAAAQAQWELDKKDYDDYVKEYGDWVEEYATWDDNTDAMACGIKPLDTTEVKKGPDYYQTGGPTGNMVFGDAETTYFPLNVNEDGGTFDTNDEAAAAIAAGNYDPKNTNTGYVIGGSNINPSTTYTQDGSNTNPRSDAFRSTSSIRVSLYGKAFTAEGREQTISNSFSGNETTYATGEFTDIRTINAAGQDVVINSTMADAFEKYSDSKDSLLNILRSSPNNYGLHFVSTNNSAFGISKNNLVTASHANIGNTPLTNYQMPANSIDFKLKDKGYINFFAGTYYSADVTTFFSLHQVIRHSATHETLPNVIQDIKEIQSVYRNPNKANYSYVYKYKDGTYSKPYRIGSGNKKYEMSPNDTGTVAYNENLLANYNLSETTFNNNYKTAYGYSEEVFDTDRITNFRNGSQILTLQQCYLYYFEIPMNSGEFCLGSVIGNSADGGYLLYLDIGANAMKMNRTIMYDRYIESIFTFSYPKGTAFLGNSSGVTSGDSACIAIAVGYVGDLLVSRESAKEMEIDNTDDPSKAKVAYYPESIESIHNPSGTDLTMSLSYDTLTETEYRRMYYIDHNVNTDEYIKTVITDKSVNGAAFVRDTVKQYYENGNEVAAADVKVYNTSDGAIISNDQGGQYATTVVIIPNGHTWTEYFSQTDILTLLFDLDYTKTSTFVLVMNPDVDEDIAGGTFYLFDNYEITYTISNSGSVVIYVKDFTTGKKIKINGVTVTGDSAGSHQTIPVPVP